MYFSSMCDVCCFFLSCSRTLMFSLPSCCNNKFSCCDNRFGCCGDRLCTLSSWFCYHPSIDILCSLLFAWFFWCCTFWCIDDGSAFSLGMLGRCGVKWCCDYFDAIETECVSSSSMLCFMANFPSWLFIGLCKSINNWQPTASAVFFQWQSDRVDTQ